MHHQMQTRLSITPRIGGCDERWRGDGAKEMREGGAARQLAGRLNRDDIPTGQAEASRTFDGARRPHTLGSAPLGSRGRRAGKIASIFDALQT